MLSSEETIARYYVGYYNRAPDPGGFEFWVSNFENGVSTLEIANFFSDQDETDALYPYFADPANNSPEGFIRAIYNNLFNRDPDDAGLDFWMEQLSTGGVDTGQMIEAIIEGATTNPDLAVVQNKVSAALYWEDQANNFSDFDYDSGAATSANDALSSVTDDAASVTDSQTGSNAYFAGLDADKDNPGDGVTDDGSEDDKVGIANPELSNFGDVGISTLDSGAVLNLDAFRNDTRFDGIDGSGQTVVVIDTGIDLDHAAFGPDTDGNGVSDRIVFSQDFTNERDGTANDTQGHGTNVASIVASSNGNYPGVAPGANIVALQALDGNGSGAASWIEEAMQWVVDNAEALNIVAVNMSLGDGTNSNSVRTHPVYGDELRALNDDLGVVTIVAAGNSYADFQTEGASSLSGDPNSISVGAVGGNAFDGDEITYFSQRSDDIPTIFAPGSFITGAAPGGGSSASSGTSQAAPHVAGMVALAQQLAQQELGRRLTPDEFEALLIQSGDTFVDDFNADDRVINTGSTFTQADIFDLGEAILAIAGGSPVPSPVDPTPDNDIPGSIDTSARIDVNSSLTSSVDFGGDDDYFEVFLAPGEYQINLTGAASGGGTLSDPYLTLLSSSGALVTQNDDGGNGLESLIDYTVTEGDTFYINASAYGNAVGTYTLSIEGDAGETGDVGDTINTAGSISPGSTVRSTLEFGADRDWFAIQLNGNETYTFDLVGDTLSDPYLYLYDQNGDIIASDDDGGEGLNSSLTFDTDGRAGTYYLSAEAYATTQTGTYTLSASGEARDDGGDFAANPGTAGTINAANGSLTSTLEIEGDRDWFRVELEAGASYDFSLNGFGNDGVRDTYLYLYDGSGNLVGSDDDGGSGLFSFLSYTADSTSSYFLEAAAYSDGYTGDYELISTQTGGGGGGGGDVPGDTSTTAVLSPGETITGLIDAPGDFDWYAVDVNAGQTYEFSLNRGGNDPITDPFLVLFDSQGNFIDLNDDDRSLDSFLEYTAEQSGRIYASAETFDLESDQGTYELSLSTDGSLPAEVPDNASTPFTLAAGQSLNGTIDVPGDNDWYAVDLQAGETYIFSMLRDGTDTSVQDPFLRLYDANNSLIRLDDDSGGSLQSRLEYTSAFSGRAYISAETFSSSSDSGGYVLSLDSGATGFSGLSSISDYDYLY